MLPPIHIKLLIPEVGFKTAATESTEISGSLTIQGENLTLVKIVIDIPYGGLVSSRGADKLVK